MSVSFLSQVQLARWDFAAGRELLVRIDALHPKRNKLDVASVGVLSQFDDGMQGHLDERQLVHRQVLEVG